MLFWRCECGATFEEKGREEPGNDEGWIEAKAHVAQHKLHGEPEQIEGLYDSETGEMIFKGGFRPLAVSQGILPYGPKGPKPKKQDKDSSSPYQGRIFLKPIDLDPAIMLFFSEAQMRWPSVYPDDDPKTIGKFILDCLITLWLAFPDKLGLGRTLQALLASYISRPEQEVSNGVGAVEEEVMRVEAPVEEEEVLEEPTPKKQAKKKAKTAKKKAKKERV